MCGFIGVFHYLDSARQVDKDALLAGLEVLSHRGPDATGVFIAGPVGLAHCRLKVIDLSAAGTQPMGTTDGSQQLVYNGEVYNFLELRRRFRLDDSYEFRSNTDTEVVLNLLVDQGPAAVREFNGMFSLGLWDQSRQRLCLARDPFGIKPLFYRDDGNSFWFASEIKALLACGAASPQPSLRALQRYLQFDYIPGDLTAFEEIMELRPGHLLMLTAGGSPRLQRYWNWPALAAEVIEESGAIENSLSALKESVSRQLISDVPVGVMLSGGIDSSALTELLREIKGNSNFHTFSLSFSDPSFDESDYALMVAQQLKTQHHVIPVQADDVWDCIPRQTAYIDEPFADGAAIPTFILSRFARRYVTVLLSGEGGDEVFAGYDTHLAYKYREWYLRLPVTVRRAIARAVQLFPVSHRKLSLEFRLKRFTAAAEADPASAHFFWRAVASSAQVRELTGQALAPADSGPSLFRQVYSADPDHEPIGKLTRVDSSYHLPDDLMIKCDRMTMAFSLEARVPFTDLGLVRRVMELPDAVRLPGCRQKYLLRQALSGSLPREVLTKKKVGMEMPYSRWFCEQWRERAAPYFTSSVASCGGWLDQTVVRRYWDEHLAHRADHGRLLWGLLNFIIWYELYIENPGTWRDYLNPVRPGR